MSYCFLTSVYKNTKMEEMRQCVDSMLSQSLPPDQIVIVIDGPVGSELRNYISSLEASNDVFTVLELEKNSGLGIALNEGMKLCKCELVARMDTDDICVLDRCARQVAFMNENPGVAVVGSNIPEFIGDISNVVAYRNVPETHEEICRYLKKRCPFNHMTVMLRKSEVLRAGGYLDWHYNEDSYLWARMYLAGCRFYNMQANLVFARVDDDTYKRRGGYSYFKSERNLFRFMRKHKIINAAEYATSVFIRFVIQVLMPNGLRKFVFVKLMRSK